MEIIAIILIPIALWLSSMYLLKDWNKFATFFGANLILIVIYTAFLIYGKSIWGHDEYGLGFLSRLVVCLLSHVVIVLIFALFKRRHLKR